MAITPTSDANVINVKNLGAKGDGKTDDSPAFIKAIAQAESAAQRNPAYDADSNLVGTITIYIPAGNYLIKSPEAMIRSSYRTRTVGLEYQGAGAGLTQILFQPSATGSYLMSNRDAWLVLHIADITFNSNGSGNNFMDSYSAGGAQRYTFDRCQWNGSWNNCLYLEGNNTNSEFAFYACNWYGSYSRMLYVSASTGSDQFVNYNFYGCNFEVSSGEYIHMEKGGNVSIYGGSLIHTGKGGTFFKLLGTTHSYGTERFLCVGTRIEHRTDSSLLIECEWPNGVVTFLNVDASSAMPLRTSTAVCAVFRSVNTRMPNVKFDNCRLIGSHQFQYTVSSWSVRHNVIYDNCTFEQHATPATFVAYTATDGNANAGGKPVVAFRNSRGNGTYADVWDCDYGYNVGTMALTSKKVVSLKTPAGRFPFSGIPKADVNLPMNAVVTNVRLYWPSGVAGSQSKTWTFTVHTSEPTPTVLAQAAGGGKIPLASGFLTDVSTFFVCNSAAKCHLVLECNSAVDQTVDGCLCLIEYLG